MVNLNDQIFSQALNNLGMVYQEGVINKAKEIFDLVSLKFSGALDDQTKITICIDIACEITHIPFDTATAVSKSAVRKSEYKNKRNLFLKLLNLNKALEVTGILLKLGVCNNSVEKTARAILAHSQKNETESSDHPQYVSMSCYFACKLHKQKLPKKNFIELSNLRPNQWAALEKSFDKWVHSVINPAKDDGKDSSTVDQHVKESQQKLKRKLNTDPEVENYDVWAQRTLKQAYAEIEAEKLAKS